MNKTLVILSIPRTGSNFLSSFINSLNEFEFFGEVYHHNTVFAPHHRKLECVEYISHTKGINLEISESKPKEDLDLVNFAHQSPKLFLESMRDTSQSKYFGCKIFIHHLDFRGIKKTILDDPSIVKIIMRRNALDAYLSNLIAANKRAYTKVKTDNVKIDFKEQNFSKWLSRIDSYYSFLDQFSNKSSHEYKHLSYEEIHGNHQEDNKFSFIIDFLIKSGFDINKEQNIKKMQKVKLHKKQDSRTNAFDKVNNPDILKKFLIKNKLEYLIEQ